MNKIYITRAVSCTGKSTWVNKNFNQSQILSSDNFREILFGDRSKQTNNDLVFNTMYSFLEQRLIHDCNVTVIDATNLKISDCKTPLELAKKYHAQVTIFDFEPPSLDVILERNKKRYKETGFFIPEYVFEKQLERYHSCLQAFLDYEKKNQDFKILFFDQEGVLK